MPPCVYVSLPCLPTVCATYMCTIARSREAKRVSESPHPVSLLASSSSPTTTRFTVGGQFQPPRTTRFTVGYASQASSGPPFHCWAYLSGPFLSARFSLVLYSQDPPFLPVLAWFCTPRTSPFCLF